MPPPPRGLGLDVVKAAAWRVVPAGERAGMDAVRLTRSWDGPFCRSRLMNSGREPARIREVVLFDLSLGLPPETRLYGEGFQMLSQTGGTLGQPVDLGDYTDAKHYRMPQPEGARAVHGVVTLSPPGAGHHLLAFTSARRFNGQFYLRPPDGLQVVVDTEGLALGAGESWDLEEFTFAAEPDREVLLAGLAAA